jgi:DNA repair/transcription protein MET18/MMS19
MPDTPNGITRDDLAAALLPCLIASPAFTEFCIPLLIEKLDSQLRVAKLDSLRVLVSNSTSIWQPRPRVKFFRAVLYKIRDSGRMSIYIKN